MGYLKELRKVIGHRPVLMPSVLMIMYKDDKILLQKRSDDGTWSFHGGGLEIGETTEEAIKRELKEELGVIPTKFQLYGVYSGERLHHIYPNGDEVYYVVTVYFCTEYEGTLDMDLEEVSDIKWFGLDNRPENIIEADKIIWEDMSTFIKKFKQNKEDK